jgi:hypothetical protein
VTRGEKRKERGEKHNKHPHKKRMLSSTLTTMRADLIWGIIWSGIVFLVFGFMILWLIVWRHQRRLGGWAITTEFGEF